MTSPIYKLSDSYIDRLAVLDPGAATYMGIPGHDHEMTDFSPLVMTLVRRLITMC